MSTCFWVIFSIESENGIGLPQSRRVFPGQKTPDFDENVNLWQNQNQKQESS